MLGHNDVRDYLKGVVERHDVLVGHFFSIWNAAKDAPSEKDYPCVVWDRPNSRFLFDEQEQRYRRIDCQVFVIGQNKSDRTPAERDQLVNDCDQYACELVMALDAEKSEDWDISNVQLFSRFDNGTEVEAGVQLSFSVTEKATACQREGAVSDPV